MFLLKLKSLNYIRIFGGTFTWKANAVSGDRKDGRLIHSLAPFYKFMPYIMPTKNDACNQFEDCIEITNTDRWLRQKRLGATRVSATCTCSSRPYIRMVSLRPGINRFVAGRHVYALQQHRGRADRAPQHVHHLR